MRTGGLRARPAASARGLRLLLLLLLRDPAASRAEDEGPALRLSLVCFDLETVRVSWSRDADAAGTNLSLRYRRVFNRDAEDRTCDRYLLDGGLTSGCDLEVKGRVLHFSVQNGSRTLLARSLLVSEYLKPRAPRDLAFSWTADGGGVTVLCPDLPYGGLVYQVQHRDDWDAQWQTHESGSCNATLRGLDPRRCHQLRARVKPKDAHYGARAAPSEWTPVTRWRRARPAASCPAAPRGLPGPGLVCAPLAALLLLLSAWKLQRVRRCLVPSVPDPRAAFPGLFERHRGNFQAWIADTQDVSPPRRPEAAEAESSVELAWAPGPEGDAVTPGGATPALGAAHYMAAQAPEDSSVSGVPRNPLLPVSGVPRNPLFNQGPRPSLAS